MSLFLKVVPFFPFLDYTNVVKIVNESEDKSMFDGIAIEFLFRTFVEIILFETLWQFKRQRNKSKMRLWSERFNIALALIIWNYVGFSKVFQTTNNNLLAPGPGSKIYYHGIELLHSWANIFTSLGITLIMAAKGSLRISVDPESNKPVLKPDNSIFFNFYFQTILFKYLIDGALVTSPISRNFLIDHNSRIYTSSGLLIRSYMNITWVVSGIETLGSPFSHMIFGFLSSLVLFCAFIIIKYYSTIKSYLKTTDYKVSGYTRYLNILLRFLGIFEATLFVFWFFNIPYHEYGADFLAYVYRLYHRTLAPVIIILIHVNRRKHEGNLSIYYLLYDYKDLPEQTPEKIEGMLDTEEEKLILV